MNEDDAIDHDTFDRLHEEFQKIKYENLEKPDFFDIVCCHCSGKKRSWEDRD